MADNADVEGYDGLVDVVPNTGLNDVWDYLQYYMRMASTTVSFVINLYMVVGILVVNRCRVKNHYQALVIAQAIVGVLASTFEQLICKVSPSFLFKALRLVPVTKWLHFKQQTRVVGVVKVGHPNWRYTPTQFQVVSFLNTVFNDLELIFLIIFNLHRYFMFTKPNLLKFLYAVCVPWIIIVSVVDAASSFDISVSAKIGDSFLMYYGFLPIVAIVILYCYVKLRKHFRETGYSERVKYLQNKLSLSILLQLLVFVVIGVMMNLVPILVRSSVTERSYDEFLAYYMMMGVIIFSWQPVITSGLTCWSIAGYFRDTHQEVQKARVSSAPIIPRTSPAGRMPAAVNVK